MPILTAVDGEQVPSRPVEVGYDLAQAFDEDLIVMHVMSQGVFEQFRNATTDEKRFPYLPGRVSYGGQSGGGSKTAYTIEDGQSDAASLARDVVDETLDSRQQVTCIGRVGEPVEEILDEIARRDTRYLVIGGRKRTPVGKAVFGSHTQSILLTADIPVMAVMSAEE